MNDYKPFTAILRAPHKQTTSL